MEHARDAASQRSFRVRPSQDKFCTDVASSFGVERLGTEFRGIAVQTRHTQAADVGLARETKDPRHERCAASSRHKSGNRRDEAHDTLLWPRNHSPTHLKMDWLLGRRLVPVPHVHGARTREAPTHRTRLHHRQPWEFASRPLCARSCMRHTVPLTLAPVPTPFDRRV